MGDKSPILAAYRSTSEHPDSFVASVEFEDNKITALVSEFQTDFCVTLGEPIHQDSQAARLVFRLWLTRLLNPSWQAQKDDQSIEVLDEEGYFLVRKVFYDENGGRRFIPWTRSESLKMVLDKNGRWLILSVADLPEVVSSMPAGGRARNNGAWFSSEVRQKDVVRKKDN